MCRSEPQIPLALIATIASSADFSSGSGRSSTRTSRTSWYVTALIRPPRRRRSPLRSDSRACPPSPGGAAPARRGSAPRRYSSASPSSTPRTWSSPIASAHARAPRGWLSPCTMPASMSAALPTPSPSANAASLMSWQTIRPSTRPGRVADPRRCACRASRRSCSAALGGRRGGVGAAGQLDQRDRSSGGSAWKPTAAPPGSSAASEPAAQQIACGPPCSGGLGLVRRRSRGSGTEPRPRPPRAPATSQPASRRGAAARARARCRRR